MNKSTADPFHIATVFRDATSTMMCEQIESFMPFTHDGPANEIPLSQVPDLVFDVLSRRWQKACSTQWLRAASQINLPTVLRWAGNIFNYQFLFVGPPLHKSPL